MFTRSDSARMLLMTIIISLLLRSSDAVGRLISETTGTIDPADSVTYADAVKNVRECPNGCYCNLSSSNKSLTVDCGRSSPDVEAERLSRALDSMLSTDRIVERLTSLTVNNTLLKRVPASVCQLLNLRTLRLDRNKLTELPDNCFTKLTRLSTISMSQNLIGGLQDGVFDGLWRMVTLNLGLNQISFIGLRVFSNTSDLTCLRHINLADNILPVTMFVCVCICVLLCFSMGLAAWNKETDWLVDRLVHYTAWWQA